MNEFVLTFVVIALPLLAAAAAGAVTGRIWRAGCGSCDRDRTADGRPVAAMRSTLYESRLLPPTRPDSEQRDAVL
ncbi:MAG: hypothetical protein HYY36_03030 [Gammaproteobacteria bacterium]|nr:hypothetical protein [Gammaproteobacteria bacterium]